MTDDNSNLVDTDNLEAFEKEFFNPEVEEVKDTEDDALANDTDTDASEEDEDAPEEESEDTSEDEDSDEDADDDSADEDEEESEPEPEDKGKRKKSDYQTRINELTKARREAERREALLLQRLEALEASTREPKDSKQEPAKAEQPPRGAPTPDDVDEKGEPKYPLREYDGQYLHDLMRFEIEQEIQTREVERAKQVELQQKTAAQEQLKTEWAQKLDEAEEEIPDIREHIADFVVNFQNLEPSYGEYLATTIMSCDNGPAIMEYLSQNIGEAQKIVASGPAAATLAIGRLEAKLEKAGLRSSDEKRNKKPSGAAAPPKTLVKGSRGQQHVRPDTEDLSAFEREFYGK